MKSGAPLLVLAAACSGPVPLTIDAPPEITHFSLLSLGSGGSLTGATPVFELAAGGTPLYADTDATQILVGWSADDLGSSAAVGARVTTVEGACDSEWPEPRWRAEWKETGLVPTSGGPVALGSPDLELCPPGDPEVELLGDCLEQSCVGSRERKSACSWSIDFSACGRGPGIIRRRPSGALCSVLNGCSPDPTSPEIELCEDRCGYDVELVPPELEAGVRRIALLGEPAIVPGSLQHPDVLRTGYAKDMVWTPEHDALWVSTRVGSLGPCGRAADGSSSLHRVPLAEGAAVTSVPGPDCLGVLASDAEGLIAIYRDADHWQLGRFDGGGTLVRSASVSASLGGPLLSLDAEPAYLEILAEVIVGVFRAPSGPDWIVAHDRSTLAQQVSAQLPISGLTAARAIYEEDRLALAAPGPSDQLLWLHPTTPDDRYVLQHLVRMTPPSADGALVWALDWAADLERRDLAIAVGPAGAIHRHSTMAPLGLIATADPADVPTAFATTREAMVRLVALSRPSPTGPLLSVAAFDRALGRWRSRPQSIGPGLASKGVTDPNGRVYLLLPLSAEIVRIDLR